MKTTDRIIKTYVFVQPGELTMAFKLKKNNNGKHYYYYLQLY